MNVRLKKEIKLLIFIVAAIVALVVSAFLIWSSLKADSQGVVTDLEKDHFTLEEIAVDPEVEYLAYVIYFNEDSKISEKGTKVNGLKEGQVVKVWTEKVSNRIVAKTIEIVDEDYK